MNFFKGLYDKIFGIHDTPQKIAMGMGLGVSFGVMPAMWPVIAVFFAVIFRVNRAAALIGSLLTNTWLTIPAFFVAVLVGDLITGLSYADLARTWSDLCKNFTWQTLFKFSTFDIIVPVLIGYIIVSLVLAFVSYAAPLTILHYTKRGNSV